MSDSIYVFSSFVLLVLLEVSIQFLESKGKNMTFSKKSMPQDTINKGRLSRVAGGGGCWQALFSEIRRRVPYFPALWSGGWSIFNRSRRTVAC